MRSQRPLRSTLAWADERDTVSTSGHSNEMEADKCETRLTSCNYAPIGREAASKEWVDG